MFRIKLLPHTDLWMRGIRYGVVTVSGDNGVVFADAVTGDLHYVANHGFEVVS